MKWLALLMTMGVAAALSGSLRAASEDVVLEARAILPAVAMDAGETPQQIALREAEARWQGNGFPNYEVDTRVLVFGPGQWNTVAVRDGGARFVSRRCGLPNQDIGCPIADPADYTIEGLFRMVRTRLARNPAPESVATFPPGTPYLVVEYDGERGYPKQISYGLSLVADSDVMIMVDEVRPLP